MKQRSLEVAAERRATWLPVGMLLVVLLVTALAARNVALVQESRRRASFEREIEQARDEFQRTIDSNLILLDGLRGLASAKLAMNREQFHSYVNALDLRRRYPGVQGLGFAWHFAPGKKSEGEQGIRARGVANFHIWPERAEGDTYPIVYLAPADEQNEAAIGFDLAADPARASTLKQVAETTKPAVFTDLQPIGERASPAQDGFLLVTPFYWGGTPPKTVAERQTNNLGFFVCSYRIGALLRSLPAATRASFRFEVYDGADTAKARLLYTSAPAGKGQPSATPPVRRELAVGDRTWSVQFTPLSQSAGRGPYLNPGIALVGGMLGVLGSVLLRIQLKRRAAAAHLAEERRLVDARFRQLIEQQLVGVYVIQGDQFTYVNPKMTEIFGYSAEEMTSRPVLDFVAESSRPLVKENIERRLSGEAETIHYQLQGRRKDGAIIEIDAHGGRIVENGAPAILGSLVDNTERLRATGKLQAQVSRLNLLHEITRAIGERQDVRSISQVVVRSLHEQLGVDFCAVCRCDAIAHALIVLDAAGCSAEAVRLLNPADGVPLPLGETGPVCCAAAFLSTEADLTTAPWPLAAKFVEAGLRSLVVAPLPGANELYGVLLAARTQSSGFSAEEVEFIQQLSEHVALASRQSELHTKLQRAYDDLRQTQQVAMQQERLRAVGQMASGIAHEINNTISPIALYAESILENEPNLSERTRGFLETMQRAIDDVASTVARLREFSRGREALINAAPVSLNNVVQEALKLTSARWKNMELEHGHVIEVREELAPDLPSIVGVESELRDALTNIILNAADAMPDGGTLTVRSGVNAPIGLMAKLSHSGQGQTFIEVSDTGPGMDEETRRRCLEPFFTTKGERGTGLGLAMVYGVAQRHAAKIDIESAPGKGTTMRLVFSPSMVPTAPPKPKPAPAPLTGPLHILLVDDDQILLKSLGDILQRDGHAVSSMDGGQAGIDAFQDALGVNPFDIVITDLGMPQVDGRKVAEAVKTASAQTPVIMMTGWGQRMQAEGDVPAHVDRLLSKPCKLRELREALADCMAGRKEEVGSEQ